MRLYLVIDETCFYHPDFVAEFLRKTPDEVVGAALVTKIPEKSDLERYLRTHWYYLRLREAFLLAYRKYSSALKERSCLKRGPAQYYSVRAVFEEFGVDYVDVEYDINRPEYLYHVKSKSPDIIVSSNSLIFGSELLASPKICCINRHSALLPDYGGLWPVFQAFRAGERYTGVSAHTMETKIDKGAVLAQRAVEIVPGVSLVDLYRRCFRESADVVLQAIAKVANNDFSPCTEKQQGCYFSFPTKEHWREFRKRGGRFI